MFRRLLLPALVFLSSLGLPLSSYGETLEDRVKEYKLDNGLRLLVLKRGGSPTFSVFSRLMVGAVDENVGETGIAHILEHMLFKGSQKIGSTDFNSEKVLMEKVEKLGIELDTERRKGSAADMEKTENLEKEMKDVLAEQRKFIVKDEMSSIYSRNGGAAFNAFTSKDTTTYIIKLPANKLELWAWLESDRLRSPVLREYYSERDVVMEERRRSIENSPTGTLYEQYIATAFYAHPYGVPVIGWASDISYLPKAKVKKFLKTYYSPNNMVTVIVGDVEPDEVFAVVKKYFGDIPSQKIPPRIVTREPEQKGERRIEVEYDAKPEVLIGFHKPAMPHKDDYVFDLINGILTNGRTSRLYKSLVLEKGIAVSVSAWVGPGDRYDNLFTIHAVPRAPHTTKDVEKAIYAELKKLAKEAVPQRELQKIMNNVEADYIRGLKSNSGLAYYLSNYEVLTGDWKYMSRYPQEIKKLTSDDVKAAAVKYLKKSNRTVATLVALKKAGR